MTCIPTRLRSERNPHQTAGRQTRDIRDKQEEDKRHHSRLKRAVSVCSRRQNGSGWAPNTRQATPNTMWQCLGRQFGKAWQKIDDDQNDKPRPIKLVLASLRRTERKSSIRQNLRRMKDRGLDRVFIHQDKTPKQLERYVSNWWRNWKKEKRTARKTSWYSQRKDSDQKEKRITGDDTKFKCFGLQQLLAASLWN